MKNKKNIYWITESAVMIALGIVLEVVSKMFLPRLPFGGQFTIVSMLPVIFVGWKYGIRKGLVSGFVYALAECVIGVADGTITAAFLPADQDGLGLRKAILMLFLDYILAYTVLGLAAMYKGAIKKNWLSLAVGAFTVLVLRYCAHITSGFILYGAWAEWFFTESVTWGGEIYEAFKNNSTVLSLVYSVIYNGLYMIPEIIITPIVAAIVGKIPQVTKTAQ